MVPLKFYVRNFTSSRSLLCSLAKPVKEESRSHGHGSSETWTKVFYFGCVPALILSALNCYMTETPPPPEFKPYEHLRKRVKKFPWGDGNKTLFHNPHRNALPEGYEEEHH